VFNVSDVDATIAAVKAAGGGVVRPGEDRPEHKVRAAVVSDNEGHMIELVGPMAAG
jgi:predicted enzyme related to lactoylglutathione lyase